MDIGTSILKSILCSFQLRQRNNWLCQSCLTQIDDDDDDDDDCVDDYVDD